MHGPGLIGDLDDLRLPVIAEQNHIVAIDRIGVDLFAFEGARRDPRIGQRRPVDVLRRLYYTPVYTFRAVKATIADTK